jgi:hypothetical protein
MKNIELFISKSKCKYGDFKYDYSLVEYIDSQTKVKIICSKHGVFEKTPNKFLMGQECLICSKEKKSDKLRNNVEDIKTKSNIIHNNMYDYSLVEYVSAHKKVKIICPIHGVFEQSIHAHVNKKRGCSLCGAKKSIIGRTLSKEDFVKNANIVHNNKYDYSLVDYKSSISKVSIICPEHGIFKQKPNIHVSSKCGCPVCNFSKGELEIKKWLEENNISYEQQKIFSDCKNIRSLRFDFFLPEHKICIEYNGRQHYQPVWGEKELKRITLTDNIKKNYCIDKNILLIEIKYNDDLIGELEDRILRNK